MRCKRGGMKEGATGVKESERGDKPGGGRAKGLRVGGGAQGKGGGAHLIEQLDRLAVVLARLHVERA